MAIQVRTIVDGPSQDGLREASQDPKKVVRFELAFKQYPNDGYELRITTLEKISSKSDWKFEAELLGVHLPGVGRVDIPPEKRTGKVVGYFDTHKRTGAIIFIEELRSKVSEELSLIKANWQIRPELLEQLKLHAVRSNKKLYEVVDEALAQYLGQPSS